MNAVHRVILALTTLAIPLVLAAIVAPLPGGLVCNGNCPGLATTQQMLELAIFSTVAAYTVALVCAKLWANDRQRAESMLEDNDR